MARTCTILAVIREQNDFRRITGNRDNGCPMDCRCRVGEFRECLHWFPPPGPVSSCRVECLIQTAPAKSRARHRSCSESGLQGRELLPSSSRRSVPWHAGHGRSQEVYSGPRSQAPPGNALSCRLRRPGYVLRGSRSVRNRAVGNVAVNGAWPLDADTSDDESLARLEQHVAALRDAHCVDCRRTLCGHESLFNVAMGLTTKPRCVSCLAAGLAMSAEGLRDHLWAHFQTPRLLRRSLAAR